MSKGGRWGLVGLAVAVAVAAFLIARPGDDDGESGQAAGTATETVTAPTATAPSAPEPPPDGPDPTTIELTGSAVEEAVDIAVAKGDEVRLIVRSDAPDEIHVHGYDISRDAAPGSPARFAFPATIEGVFEIESHEAEHAGLDALIARLVVEPN
jgi:FtsP/CotA-like multicopper oxidase with cupredoxin domain